MTKIDVTLRTLTDTNARDVRRGRQHCLKLAAGVRRSTGSIDDAKAGVLCDRPRLDQSPVPGDWRRRFTSGIQREEYPLA